jgi:hypothetical protein
VPVCPAGQLHGAGAVLEEEPQAPGYVVHKIAVWRPTVSMTISGVCRYSPGGNYVGQFPYGQGAAVAAAVAEEEATLSIPPPVTGEETAQAPESEVIQEVPPQ